MRNLFVEGEVISCPIKTKVTSLTTNEIAAQNFKEGHFHENLWASFSFYFLYEKIWWNRCSIEKLYKLTELIHIKPDYYHNSKSKEVRILNTLLPSLNKIYHICIQDWNKSITTLSPVFYLLIVIGKQLPSYRQVSEKSDTQFFLFFFTWRKAKSSNWKF